LASILSVSTLSRTVIRAVGDTNHAVFIFNPELELTAASICTDSASTRQALNRRQSWSEDKQRHVGTAFHYVRPLVRQGAIEVLAVNDEDNVSDTLTKGYESTPQRINEFHRLARICHGYRLDTPRPILVAAFLALHALRAISWDTVVRRGSRWRLQHGSAEVDIPNKARFT
jgi:hypothetical protein